MSTIKKGENKGLPSKATSRKKKGDKKPKTHESVKLAIEFVNRVRNYSEETGIPMGRIIADAGNKELDRLEKSLSLKK